MLAFEKRAWNYVLSHLFWIVIGLITACSFWIRFAARDFYSGDMQSFLLPWFAQIKASGGFQGLKQGVGNYSLVYQTIIALFSELPFDPAYMYKLLSVVFDYLLGAAAGWLVYLLTDSREKGGAAYAAAVSLPMVWLNSAWWGQCDSIYTFFCVLAVAFCLKERFTACFIAYGFAFAFKLQAVFLAPFLLFAYLYTKKFSLLHFLIVPLVMVVLSVPALLMGHPAVDIVKIYADQTTISQKLSFNYASFWNLLLGNLHEEFSAEMRISSILLTAILLLLMMWAILRKKRGLSGAELLKMSFLFSYTCIFLLPSMHERYDYLPVILCLSILFLDGKMAPVFLGMMFINLLSYGRYLFHISVDWTLLSAVNLACFAFSVSYILRAPGMEPAH